MNERKTPIPEPTVTLAPRLRLNCKRELPPAYEYEYQICEPCLRSAPLDCKRPGANATVVIS